MVPQYENHGDGLVQDCSISIAIATEILQSCTKTSMDSAGEPTVFVMPAISNCQ